MAEAQPIPLGKLVAGHGVRGLARIRPYNPGSPGLLQCREVWLTPPGHASPSAFRVSSCRPHGNVLLAQLDGIDSLNALEPWIGSEVSVAADALPPPSDDEIYQFEALGLSVQTADGVELGVVAAVLSLPSNDVWVVRRRGDEAGTRGEALIPAVAPIVKRVDLAARVATVEPIEGLLDDLRG